MKKKLASETKTAILSESHQQDHTAKQSTSNRGFAAMNPEKRKEIAKRGGSVLRRNRIKIKDQLSAL